MGAVEVAEITKSNDVTTADSLGHAFCGKCYPVGGDVVVGLCGALWDGDPITKAGPAECAVCESFARCPSCGLAFYKPWGDA